MMPRRVLDQGKAVEIYAQKIAALRPSTYKASLITSEERLRGKRKQLSKRYGVSAKTIRDVWNRKSWFGATEHLWKLEICNEESPPVRIFCNMLPTDWSLRCVIDIFVFHSCHVDIHFDQGIEMKTATAAKCDQQIHYNYTERLSESFAEKKIIQTSTLAPDTNSDVFQERNTSVSFVPEMYISVMYKDKKLQSVKNTIAGTLKKTSSTAGENDPFHDDWMFWGSTWGQIGCLNMA